MMINRTRVYGLIGGLAAGQLGWHVFPFVGGAIADVSPAEQMAHIQENETMLVIVALDLTIVLLTAILQWLRERNLRQAPPTRWDKDNIPY